MSLSDRLSLRFLWLFIIEWLEIIDGTSWRWQWHSIIFVLFFFCLSHPFLYCTKNSKNPNFFLHFTIDAVNMDFLLIHKYLSSYCFGDRWLTLEVHYGNIKTTWWNSRLFTFCLLFNKKRNKNLKVFFTLIW